MARAKTLSFHATQVEYEVGGGAVPSLSFTVEADGDPSTYFSITAEEPEERLVRVWWGDGDEARDETVVTLSRASLTREAFEAKLDQALGPYSGISLTFDELDDDEASGVASALFQLARGLGDGLELALPGVEFTKAATATAVPRRVGAPMLGVAAKGEWRVRTSTEIDVVLVLSNIGGALEKGVLVEVAGVALEKSLVAPRFIRGKSAGAEFEKAGAITRALLPELKLAADFDVDRRTDKKAARPPTTELTLSLRAEKAGSGLLTVRMVPAGRPDRSGSAMVGRTIVVEG